MISLILIHYQSNYLFTDMRVGCLFYSVLSSRPRSLALSSSDKIAALSQAIAYEAKGHSRNDRANMTDISRSCLMQFHDSLTLKK